MGGKFISPFRSFQSWRNWRELSARPLILWLLRDEFTDTRAAGAVNGTPATPGGTGSALLNTRFVNDPDVDALTTDGSQVNLANPNAAWGSPGLWYSATLARNTNPILIAKVITSNPWTDNFMIGWDGNQAGIAGPAVWFRTAAVGIVPYDTDASTGPAGVFGETATVYWVAIQVTSAGCYYFIYGGAYVTPSLLYFDKYVGFAALYPAASNNNAIHSFTSVRVPEQTVLVPYLAYDTFTRGNGAIGSTEDSGPETQALASLAWTTQSGTWAVSANKAVATALGIVTLPTADTGDLWMRVTVTTPAAGVTPGGLILRWTDANNYWYVRITPGTAGNDLDLIKVVGGVPSASLAAADIDWVANTEYEIGATCDSNNFWKVMVDDAQELSYVVPDAFNVDASVVGLIDEGNSNMKFDDVHVLDRAQRWLRPFFGNNPQGGRLFPVGDSKANPIYPWVEFLTADLRVGQGDYWGEDPGRYQINGASVAVMDAYVAANLDDEVDEPTFILFNLGVNDMATAEVPFKTSCRSIFTAFNAKWPSAQIYLMRIWRRTFDAESAVVNGWLDDLIAEQDYLYTGPDESVWLENGDNGVTYTTDGIHYTNPGGCQLAADQWRASIGY